MHPRLTFNWGSSSYNLLNAVTIARTTPSNVCCSILMRLLNHKTTAYLLRPAKLSCVILFSSYLSDSVPQGHLLFAELPI